VIYCLPSSIKVNYFVYFLKTINSYYELLGMSINRVKKFRESLKLSENAGKRNIYGQKHREHQKRYALKQLQNGSDEYRSEKAEYMRQYRLNKEEAKMIALTPGDSFRSVAAKSKAIRKVEKVLPKTLNKRVEVIKKLAAKYDVSSCEEKRSTTKPRRGFEETKNLVINYFASDHISRAMPGIKDCVRVQSIDGDIQKVQKRLLLMKLSDVHDQFQRDFPTNTIKLSKFCELRPSNVLYMSSIVQENCLCEICQNFSLSVQALSPYSTDKCSDVSKILPSIMCNPESYECAAGLCNDCRVSTSFIKNRMPSEFNDDKIMLRQWRKGNEGYFQKALVEDMTVCKLIDMIMKNIPALKLHKFIETSQQQAFYKKKKEQNDDQATIVVDFAENYLARMQHEIQKAFFGRKQISLFTCVSYVGSESPISIVIASDDLQHTKEQVHTYIKFIIEYLKGLHPHINHIEVFSDGAASQFKNRFTLSLVHFAPEDFGVTMSWNFFATSHGKSSADGLGGTVKRGVYARVLTGAYEVYWAREFVDCAKTFCEKIHLIEITPDDVKNATYGLSERWNKIKAIPQTRMNHFFTGQFHR
jgi:hypothetical protein